MTFDLEKDSLKSNTTEGIGFQLFNISSDSNTQEEIDIQRICILATLQAQLVAETNMDGEKQQEIMELGDKGRNKKKIKGENTYGNGKREDKTKVIPKIGRKNKPKPIAKGRKKR